MKYDVIIIGGGAAGLGAALYSARYTLKTLLIAKEFGGTGNIAHMIDNWIGTPGITGPELMKNFISHVDQYKVPKIEAEVTKINKNSDGSFSVTAEGKIYRAKAVIYALGMKHRQLNVKGEKEYSSKGVHYCYTCLVPGTKILTNPDILDIKDIKDEKIFTHKGQFTKFKEKIETSYTGPVLSITPRFFGGKTTLTPNHRVFAIRRTWKNYKSVIDRKKLKPEWIPAAELKTGDYAAFPIIKKTEDIELLDFGDYFPDKKISNTHIQEKHKTHSSKKLPRRIRLSKDLLRLFGYYIAEGCTSHNGIVLHFNKKEINYIEDVIKTIESVFEVKCKTITKGQVTKIYCYSKILKEFFSIFGNYAHKKKLPQEFLYLPLEKQKEIVKGMWRGDGCKRKKDFCYVTNSKKLAHQLKMILMRFGIIPRVELRKKENLKSSWIDGREIKFNHDKYHIYISGPYLKIGEIILNDKHDRTETRNRIMHYGWINQDYAYLPIRNIQEDHYSGKVYDLAVENHNSYSTENLCVHNCDGPLYSGRKVAVVGGSDSAALGALFLADYAKKVTILYRKERLRAEPISTDQVYAHPKIEVIHNVNIKEFYGSNFLEGVLLDNGKKIELNGVFVEIGHIPLTDLAEPLKIKTNSHGFVVVDNHQKTNVKGFAAAGDITTMHTLKQFITSASEGSVAAETVYKYINQGKW